MKESSVSPERWLAITPQPASFAIFTAWIDSVTVPIWFTCHTHRGTKDLYALHQSVPVLNGKKPRSTGTSNVCKAEVQPDSAQLKSHEMKQDIGRHH